MQAFDYLPAVSVDEAVAALAAGGAGARALGGGTDLIAQIKEGRRSVARLVDLKRIPALTEIKLPREGGAWIGAAVTCCTLNQHAEFRQRFPGMYDSTHLIGGVQIQGRATLGGNLCNASPAADAIPNLIAHRVRVHVSGPGGARVVPVEAFCVGPGRTVLAAGELVVAFEFPASPVRFGAAYLRFTPRNEMDIAVAGAAAAVELDAAGQNFKSVRLALGAVGPTPLLVEAAGARLAGLPVNDASLELAGSLARAAAKPITDMRGTIEQRQHLADVLSVRALRIALDRARGTRTVDALGRPL
ncbi:MAG: xanthine dehydrogenase family protein subunit M [Opitutus sp.]|nr:xanthine dehydrogenase family protein subunit M [Opitutus sp.]